VVSTTCPPDVPSTVGRIEVADVFRRFGPAWQASHALTSQQGRVLDHIIDCRTPVLGGHVDTCDHCGQTWRSYNSCRDRHCPTCQGLQQLRWIEKRQERLISTHHFHVVFTLPSELRPLALANPKQVYGLLFKAAKTTLLELARDRWDAMPGITSVLHTWTRQMLLHPHLHCIVTGGGLADDDGWVASRPNFLFPVRVMGALFRGKFLDGLLRAYLSGNLQFVGTSAHLEEAKAFDDLMRCLYEQSWVVFAKRPFGGAAQVLKYLGRYTHRVAISSSRMVAIDEHQIVFHTHGEHICRLTPGEFIRRFLLHVLPKGFRKIRHYGLFAPSNVSTRLPVAQNIAAHLSRAQRRANEPVDAVRPARSDICPACKVGRLWRTMLPRTRAPPPSGP